MDSRLRQLSPVVLLLLLAGCGGGGGGGTDGSATVAPAREPATVSVVLTDASTDEYDAALATITDIVLLGEDGPRELFAGRKTVDLLRLRDAYEFFAVAGDFEPGEFEKIRLVLAELVLVKRDAGGTETRTRVRLPGNGKLDLNPRSRISIGPGDVVAITIDVDMEKSLKFITTGNGRVMIRPVIFVDIDTRPPTRKFTRVAGEILRLFPDSRAFLLCRAGLVAEPPGPFAGEDSTRRLCLDVLTDDATGLFGPDGLPVDFAELMLGDEVTVAGRLAFRKPPDDCELDDPRDDCPLGSDEDAAACPPGVDDCDADRRFLPRILLNAFVVEQGGPGTFRRWRGTVAGPVDPLSSRFDFQLAAGQGLAGEPLVETQLYPRSRIFDRNGTELDAGDLQTGQAARIDAVLRLSSEDPDELRAALVILAADAADGEVVLIGRILSVDAAAASLRVSTASGDRCVDLAPTTDIYLVRLTDEGLESERVTAAELEADQPASLFGTEGTDGCFDAATIITGMESAGDG